MTTLFKVCMGATFAEEPDRVGVIQALDLAAAVRQLEEWVDGEDWGGYSQVGEADIQVSTDLATVRYESADPDGGNGIDEYQVRPIREGWTFMFLVEDWPYVFGRLERHL